MFLLSWLDTDWGAKHEHTNIYAISAQLASGGNVPNFLNDPRKKKITKQLSTQAG